METNLPSRPLPEEAPVNEHIRNRIRTAVRSSKQRASHRCASGPNDNPLTLVAGILGEESRRRGAVDVSQATDLAQRAIAVLFDDAGGVSPGATYEALAGMNVSLSRSPRGAPTGGVELVVLLGILATHRLFAERRADEEKAAALYTAANLADDEIVKRSGPAYFLRPPIASELDRGLSRLPDTVRHIDLVVALKWALVATALDSQGVYDIGLSVLRDLPDRIARRIEETFDGEGPGPTPSGRPLDPRRVAGRVLQAPRGAVTAQRYRSLPRLKAEACFELGRALSETRFGASESNLEEAHRQLERAAVGYFAAGDAVLAATSASLAAECLDRLLDLAPDREARRERVARLAAFGGAVEQQIERSDLPVERRTGLSWMVGAIGARAVLLGWVDDLERPCPEGGSDALRAVFDDHFDWVASMIGVAVATRDEDPWKVLLALSACTVSSVEFVSTVAHAVAAPSEAPDDERARFICKVLGKWCDADLLRMFIDALVAAARDLREPSRALARPLAQKLRRHPLASPRRLFEATRNLLRLSAAAGIPLSQAQWDEIAAILDPIGVPPALLAAVLSLQDHETAALNCSLRGGVPDAGYFERRIRTLEHAIRDPLLSSAERAVISGWLWRLGACLRPYADDLRALPAERALWFFERFGAAAYRADVLWFGRGEVVAPRMIGPPQDGSPPRGPAASTATADAWTIYHRAREQLDLWARFRVAEEVRRVNPYVDAAFAGDLAQPTRSTATFPRDLSPEEQDEIERITRMPRDRWTITDTYVLVDIQPKSHDHVCQLVDDARGALTMACRQLGSLSELDQNEPLPDVDPERLRAFLLGPPARAIVVTETVLPIPVPLAVFVGRGGAIERHDVGRTDEKESNGQVFRVLHEMLEVIQEDRKRPDGASFEALGAAIVQVERTLGAFSTQLADLLAGAGVTEVLFLTRGIWAAYVPWEDLPAGDDARFGERFVVGHVHTLASLPGARSAGRRGVTQIHGDGSATALMQPAAAIMRCLSEAGRANRPLAGAAARDGELLFGALGVAERLRFFVHGFHHPTRPTADRLTLVDLADDARDVHLSPEIIRMLPLRGLRCVELWACEGAAHGRHLMEHGRADEPEDLTTAFLLAGAARVIASRWHVPALPSALLMERFALLVDAGMEEAPALSTARRELRGAFATSGPIERVMTERLAHRRAASEAGADTVTAALCGALQELRADWYGARGFSPPEPLPLADGTLGRLVRIVPSRTERAKADAERMPVTLNEILGPLRNPACWAGWGLRLRSIDAWDV